MFRTTFAILLALTAPATAQVRAEVTGSLGPASPVLKRTVTVTGDVARIGDFLDNAGPAANIPIFRAPDLGSAGIVPAAQVLQAARKHNVIGIDAAGVSEVLVTHVSRIITAKDVEARIAEAIAAQQGLSGDSEFMAKLDRELRPMHVESTVTAPLQVARLSFDPRSGHFDVQLELPGSAIARRLPLRFSGTASETMETATLARPMARGEIVRRSDIAIERRPKADVNGEFLGDAGRIVGLSLRRALRAGQILRQADLMKTELVQRNESVTVIFEVPGIMLTSRGKALESGAEGDVISLLNVQSKRTIQGTVTGSGTVTVTSMKPRVAAIAAATDVTSLQNPRTE